MRHPQLYVLMTAVVVLFGVSHPTHAATNKTITTFDTAGTARDVIVAGKYAYIADVSDGVVVLDVSTPSAPRQVGSFFVSGAQKLDISGNRLYVAAGSAGMIVLDISSPTAPTMLGSFVQTGLDVAAVATSGSYVYILGALNAQTLLEVVNVSDPAAISLLGSLSTDADADVIVSGARAYLVGGRTLDIVEQYPTFSIVGTYADPNAAADYHGVQVFGSVAYVNDRALGLHAINVADPAAPVSTFDSATEFPGLGYGDGLAISNGYVFVSLEAGGVAIYDIASTSTPHYLNTFSGPGAFTVTVANDVAYVAAGTSGIQVINVGAPDATPPVITPPTDPPPVIVPGGKFVDPGVTATDNSGGTTTTVTGKVDTNKVGKYELTYTVTDRAGNSATTKRVVYVGPLLETVKLKNNTLTIKVGKKNVTINPFPGYRGAIVARKATLNTKSDPSYFFISSGATKNPSLAVYNAVGKLVKRQSLKTIGTFGYQVELASNPVTLSIFIAIAPKANGLSTTIYNLSKSGLKSLGTVTHAKGKGTLVIKLLNMYSDEYGLVTLLKGSTKPPLVWRYSTSKKVFVRDTKFVMSKLLWTKTSVKLK